MENASKALIMAATVLLGVMLISIGVYLFSIFGDFSSQISNNLSQKEINEFNAKFYQYMGKTDCRAHDIVSVANLAKENNNKYGYTESDKTAPYYIIVKVQNKYANFESERYAADDYTEFIKNNSLSGSTAIYFECTGVSINPNTGLVNKIVFEQIAE